MTNPSVFLRSSAENIRRCCGTTVLFMLVVAMYTTSLDCLSVVADETVYRRSVVAADHPAASEAGAEMLRQGGNVVDAAVATSFALSVVRPESCGIGGGGFLMIWDAKKQTATTIDYRETAPAAATSDMFASDAPNADEEPQSVRGGKAVGVPGTVAGLCYVATEFGSLPLKTLLQPAIRLAVQGVPVDGHDVSAQSSTLRTFAQKKGYRECYPLLWKDYLNGGTPWQPGDRFHSPQLETLQLIAEHGADGFYRGSVAQAIVQRLAEIGGVITMDDLANVKPRIRESLRDDFCGATIYTMPPASSGGIALLQTFQTLEHWQQRNGRQLKDLGHNSADYVHTVAEAMKHAFADRAEFLGDTDFVDVPVQRLLSSAYATDIAAHIDARQVMAPKDYGRFFSGDDAGTSHFSVIDAEGNAVACTETINLTFGSFVVVPRYGIVLNNQIDDFAARPGKPNAFGLVQSPSNAIEAGKKPLSSMTPTIVVKNGRAVFSSGASGGPRIISATIQATLNHLIFDMPPHAAVSAPRFHHQWFPDELLLETTLFEGVGKELKTRGHQVVQSSSLAACQSVAQSSTGLLGGSDPRKRGQPAGQ